MSFLVHHLLRSSFETSPGKESIVCGNARLSYRDTWERVCGLAASLRHLGVERGDRVGIYMEPSVEQALAIFAVSCAGGAFVPVNEVLFPDQVAHIAADCGLRGIITSASRLERTREALTSAPVDFVICSGETAPSGLAATTMTFEDAVAASVPDDWSEWCIGKDLAALIYTSGSTGKAKGVMLSHEQVLAGSRIVSSYLGIDREHRTLAALPFSFDAGLNQLMTAMQHGATVVIKPFTFARQLVGALVEEEITGMGGVPPLWSLMAQPSSSLHKGSYPHLRYISNTGGAMPVTVLESLRESLPDTSVFLMYGLTEAFRSTFLPPEDLDRRPTSMGKAIPETEILVVNDKGEPCAPDEVGELVHRGPTVSMGYWGQPELTAQSIRPHPLSASELGDSERVVYSGDLVRRDEDGFLYFVSRRDAMIKSAGFRVSPTEVETILFQSGTLREAAVIGVPDEILGQSIKAFVVPRDGLTSDADALIALCAEHLPRHMVPKAVEAMETLPKTGSGKIDYPSLRRLQEESS